MKQLITLFILLLTVSSANAQTIEQQIRQVETNLLPVNIFEGEPGYTIQERMKFYDVPGVSITVVKDFRVLWTRHYGWADKDEKIPVTDETMFNVGSCSKGLAALTVLSLSEQGKLNIYDDINTNLISWKVPENQFTKGHPVTPALLMNHSGGAMHHFSFNYTRDPFPTITQLLNGTSPAQERPALIDRIPGTEFLYSNPGYAMLQQLIEDINGKPFYVTADENIFQVLKMSHTTFHQPLPHELEKKAAAAYVPNRKLPVKRYFYPNAAAGGLWTTTSDYAQYVIELQKSYLGKSNQIISQAMTQEMLQSHVSKQYGYGVFIRKMKGTTYFGHMGDNAGFFAGYLAHRTDGYAVIVFTNSGSGAELIREIIKSVAQFYHWEDMQSDTEKLVPISQEEKEKISGRYKSGSDEAMNIEMRNGALYLASLGNEQLYHVGNNTFKIKRRKGQIKFIKDNKGQYSSAQYAFADNIGRIAAPSIAVKMDAGEKIPSELLNEGRVQEAFNAYQKIFNDRPQDPAVSENRLNMLGYHYLTNNRLEQALCVFKLNSLLYPESANVYDSYGEALAKNGETAKAIENYEKSVQLNPDSQNAKAMLIKLRKMSGKTAND